MGKYFYCEVCKEDYDYEQFNLEINVVDIIKNPTLIGNQFAGGSYSNTVNEVCNSCFDQLVEAFSKVLNTSSFEDRNVKSNSGSHKYQLSLHFRDCRSTPSIYYFFDDYKFLTVIDKIIESFERGDLEDYMYNWKYSQEKANLITKKDIYDKIMEIFKNMENIEMDYKEGNGIELIQKNTEGDCENIFKIIVKED